MTFNTHEIPKETKIGYQRINVEPYIPNLLQISEVWAPPGPMYTTISMQMWRI